MASPAAYNFQDSKLLWTPAHPSHAICERLRRNINMKRELKLSASIPAPFLPPTAIWAEAVS